MHLIPESSERLHRALLDSVTKYVVTALFCLSFLFLLLLLLFLFLTIF